MTTKRAILHETPKRYERANNAEAPRSGKRATEGETPMPKKRAKVHETPNLIERYNQQTFNPLRKETT